MSVAAVTPVGRSVGSARSERGAGMNRAGRLVLLAVVALLLGAAGFKAYRLTLPTDGWSLSGEVWAPTFVEDLLRADGDLRPGDVLLAVDGVPYTNLIGAALAGRRAGLAYRAGAVSTYTVWRDGAPKDLRVPVTHWSREGVARAAWRTLTDTPFGGVYRWLAWLVAAFVFARRPANLAARLLFLLESVTASMAISAAVAPVSVADALSPALFYAARTWGDLLTWLVVPPLALHFLLVFPGARPVRRGLLAAVYALPWTVLALVWTSGLAVLVPLLAGAYSVANLVAVVVVVVGHGSGAARASVRWLAFGFGLSGLLSLLFWLRLAGLLPLPAGLSGVLFDHCLCDLIYVACIAVALVRHQLFDIDVIIHRTLVYGGLTACVVALYVGIVGSAGRLLGSAADLPLSLATVGLLALAFDPLRSRLQRGVNRLVYGYRDEPYRVLENLGRRLELAEGRGSALQDATRSIGEALRLPYVAVEVGATTVASHGPPVEAVERFAMLRSGELLGHLVASPRPGEGHLARSDRGLLAVLAGQLAKVVHAMLLEADLVRSRLASLNAREEARRRLGSDLHDDVGSRLTSLVRQAERAGSQVDADPAASKRSLAQLVDDVKAVASRVRALAHQLHPPELALLGLAGAVRERLDAMGTSHEVRVHLTANALGSLPAAVELGAYGVVQEALANVVKHANATNCWVRLRVTGRAGEAGGAPAAATAAPLLAQAGLIVEVEDDGSGMGPAAASPGLGVASMRARALELGGTLTVGRGAAGGTRVTLRVPLPAVAPAGTR